MLCVRGSGYVTDADADVRVNVAVDEWPGGIGIGVITLDGH